MRLHYLPTAQLDPGSNPSACDPIFEGAVDAKRRVHCRRYERCLCYAVKMGWESFDCLGCDVDEPVAPLKPR